MIEDRGIFEVFAVGKEDADVRLDVFVVARDTVDTSRSQIRKAVERGQILINGQPAPKPGVKLAPGDQVECRIQAPEQPNLAPEDIPLDIIHEDSDVLVLVKPSGMVVHPAPGHPKGTLVNALLYHCQALSEPLNRGTERHLRPGIVHRLDRDTSGVMVAARSDRAMRALSSQFADHSIDRRYLSLAWCRNLPDSGTFDTPHGRHLKDRRKFTGREQISSKRRAVTHWEVLERYDSGTGLVACTLETGRTHQIRVHMSEGGAPILGDAMYGTALSQTRHIGRQALHAEVLGFEHPNGRRLRFEAPPPQDFQTALDALRSGKAR